MFRTQLVARDGGEEYKWRLELPLVWEEDNDAIVVPAGFITDLASIPQILQNVIPVNGRHRAAAVLHDYLFVTQERTRRETDALFLRAMVASGVPSVQRYAMYAAVRLGGWLPWRHNAQQRQHNRAAFLASYGLA
ncbi:DUF1353 domain-containing protein [Aromatoleum toluclasticum]|uniref:DUF1353 domain-containing protein n=1 Tax=Aromatoleum toluclasticum TaxID=92003 RepID=UPI0012F8C9E2|nr:DUF1353 domain-containing protein [Aromatoleum toluclasticum]